MNKKRVMLVDLDVDCPNDAILLGKNLEDGEEISFFKPIINNKNCIKCGKCAEACPENALFYVKNRFPILFEQLCSGCSACKLVCPKNAIVEGKKILGKIYVSEFDGIKLVSGELKLTEARSPLVVFKTKQKAFKIAKKEVFDIILIDTAPGIHNPVVRAIQGADFALAITEPTPLGAHDLSRILDLTKSLGISTNVVLNKANIKGGFKKVIYDVCKKFNVKIISEIPFDDKLIEAYTYGIPLVKLFPNSESAKAIFELANYVAKEFKYKEL